MCIVGAGFTGLWTAYELRRADPSLEVVVLEERSAGFGASGRNGGWVVGALAGRWEADPVMRDAIERTVDEVGAAIVREGIDCDFVKAGSLAVAQTPLQLGRVRARAGEEQLDAEAAAARVRVEGVLGAAFTPQCARVQPAKLARGLAAAAERAGAVVHESTRVTRIDPGVARTAAGDVRARVVVRATEGYTAALPGLRRALVPMNSAMIVTEPLPGLDALWPGAETLQDAQHRFVYLQRTTDGRIAIGGRGVPYRFGSRSDREGVLPAVTAHELRTRLAELFPALRGARIDAGWAGVLGVPRDWTPAVGVDRASGLAWAGGYVGEGVAASNLAARTLRDLILERDTELTRLPWVRPLARGWEPEPLRWLGIRGVYALYGAADRRERRTGRPALAARVADRVAGR